MEFIFENWEYIAVGLGLLYPPILYVLPKAQANKLRFGVIAIKKLAELLEKAGNTEGGVSHKKDEK